MILSVVPHDVRGTRPHFRRPWLWHECTL